MDALDLEVISLKTLDEIIEDLHGYALQEVEHQKVRIRMPLSSSAAVLPC